MKCLEKRKDVVGAEQYQYNMNGTAIKIWNSIKEAAQFLNINYQGISMCCRNERKTCGGYMWSYTSLDMVRKYSEKRGDGNWNRNQVK